MKIKNLISLFIILSLVFCLTGCSDAPVDNTESPATSSTPAPSLNPDVTVPNEPDDKIDTSNIIREEKDVWEKEKQEIAPDTILIDSNWAKYIMVGDVTISAINLTDISVIPNYYYGDNDSRSDLQTIYHVPTIAFSTINKLEIDKFAAVELNIVSTSYGPKTNADRAYDAIIEEVRFVSTINPYEGGLETLRNNGQSMKDGYVGIGSTYNNVLKCLGEPTNSFTDPMDDIKLTTHIYSTNNTELILTFMWFEKEGIESAVVTSIDWLPNAVRRELYSQDNIEEFARYQEVMLDQAESNTDSETSDTTHDGEKNQIEYSAQEGVESEQADTEAE